MHYLYGRINRGHGICPLYGGCPLFGESAINRGFTVYSRGFCTLVLDCSIKGLVVCCVTVIILFVVSCQCWRSILTLANSFREASNNRPGLT